jgi:hypothetical protein
VRLCASSAILNDYQLLRESLQVLSVSQPLRGSERYGRTGTGERGKGKEGEKEGGEEGMEGCGSQAILCVALAEWVFLPVSVCVSVCLWLSMSDSPPATSISQSDYQSVSHTVDGAVGGQVSQSVGGPILHS